MTDDLMTQLFVSYARSDGRDLALKLRDDLLRLGLKVWLDTREIELGGSFTEDIERAIDTCDVALLLLSKGSLASSWCRVEQLRALRKGKKVIPLRVQHDTEPPLHLEHLNALDFSQTAHYDDHLRDLVSDIAASQAFRAEPAPATSPSAQLGRIATERRSAAGFRRAIRDMRQEAWGLRSWWTHFLFYATDMPTLAQVLADGRLQAPRFTQPKARSQWDRYVRFSFRPRTPHFFDVEGFLPSNTRPHLPVPVWMLFDMEALLVHPQARFSDGNPSVGASTFATPRAFAELPFEQIYHDSWMRSHERDELLRHREAQVLLPEEVTLEALQLIWVRSEAEYDTLHSLLDKTSWQHWRDKITSRADLMLFNHKRAYVARACLAAQRLELCFNPCRLEDATTYALELEMTYADGRRQTWQEATFKGQGSLVVALENDASAAYQVRLTLDGHLAYGGRYDDLSVVL